MADVFEIVIEKDEKGNPIPLIKKFTREQIELLRMLNESGAWILYRRILNQQLQALLFSTLAEDNPTKMAKSVGQVAGMNFAINQLGSILDVQNKKAKHVENETKNSSQAEGQRQEF